MRKGDFRADTHSRTTLGVRPEHLGLRHAGTVDKRMGLAAEVEVVEPLGAETLVYCRAGGHRAVARVHPDMTVGRGDNVTLIPEPAHMHFFDP